MFINKQVKTTLKHGEPVISEEKKKKEMIGNLKILERL
jgi:hypothetical protein